jgi:hypothetical protein
VRQALQVALDQRGQAVQRGRTRLGGQAAPCRQRARRRGLRVGDVGRAGRGQLRERRTRRRLDHRHPGAAARGARASVDPVVHARGQVHAAEASACPPGG